MKQKYTYDGYVIQFGKVIGRLKATTFAESSEKAANNLCYRYKLSHGLSGPGSIVKLDELPKPAA